MGEAFLVDGAAGATLEGIVAHGCGGIDGFGNVTGIEPAACLLRMVGPDAGIAVGLQLQPDRQGVVAALVHASAGFFHLLQRAGEVLHVVAHLVGDDIGLGRVTGRAQLVLQHPVEGQVDVDLAVARAVEGAGSGDAHAAGRLGAAGKQHETRWCVAGAIGCEDLRPDILGAGQHHGDEALAGVVLPAHLLGLGGGGRQRLPGADVTAGQQPQ